MATIDLKSPRSPSKRLLLSFRIPYHTQWGQSLLVSGSEPVLGSWNVKRGLLLTPVHANNELLWCGTLSVPVGFRCEYGYFLVDDEREVLRWEGSRHTITLTSEFQEGEVVEIHDLWQTAKEALFNRSAFKDVVFHRRSNSESYVAQNGFQNSKAALNQQGIKPLLAGTDYVYIHFRINCPKLEDGVSVIVTGSCSMLGRWEVKNGLKLICLGGSIWQADCRRQNAILEIGPNRELTIDSILDRIPRHILASDGVFREASWRGVGVAIPMFSVRSEDDLGVGEFLDLKLLIDWAVDSGFHLIQLLPVNDTSVHGMWWDSYPYSSLSVFALHPLYLRVQALSKNFSDEIENEIIQAKSYLDLKDVDYEATMNIKISIAKKVFSVEKDAVLSSSSFQKFFSENEDWLKPYAAFCFLKEFFETSDHTQWGSFAKYSVEKLEKIVSKNRVHYDIICFHYYIQYHLHLQLSDVASYARRKGVVLKGDLPIGVDRWSVDTWVYPNLFRMNTSTGAPPDYFDKNGQNWGFPTYNWEEMSKDNYAWWRSRLSQMGKYFTAYRIDHILGFFRIWELPEHAITGLLGKFRPSIPLSQEELEKEGIWDFNRLTHPYIRKDMLEGKFGRLWTVVASTFLNEYQKLCYEFKEDCNTEKRIAAKLKSAAERILWIGQENKIQNDLFDLLKNVVLIRDEEDTRKFYPRFNMEDTSSFKDLDDHSKNVLKRLYYDYYFHRQEILWRKNALKTLPALLNSSNILACGEDLGLIPSCVHPVMQELGIIGLRIQRMPSDPGLEFGIPSKYDYMTVCAPSCHDCSTLRAWWEESEERRERYFKEIIGDDGIPPSSCVPSITYNIIQQHFESPSMWAIFPLQDLLALKEIYTIRPAVEETINDPTNPKHYWRYRMHVSLETLLSDNELTMTIKDLVVRSGRSSP
ncbi:4-alpha-glucanotransferase [Nymphaea thermarum]|nr:4-alpha-glucanotransferase [Nymphaea thermarum]